MKKLKLFIGLIVAASMFTACLVDDDVMSDSYESSPNLVGFVNASAAGSFAVDGENKTYSIPLNVTGPQIRNLTTDVSVTISVNAASTAIEGTHYEIDNTNITLSQNENFIDKLNVTIITDGITPPETYTLVLDISSSTGDAVINGRREQIVFTINYSCFADLSGDYLYTNDFCNTVNSGTISPNSDGSWFLSVADGGFLHTCTSNTSLLNEGNINVVCGVVLPTTDLAFGSDPYYIGQILGGTWDEVAGVLSMQHQDSFFNGGPYFWNSTYVRQ